MSYRKDEVSPRTPLARDLGLARQMMSADLVTRGDGWERGVRSVLLQNDIVAIEAVVDRGLDIAGARIRQLPVAWLSPTGIVAPWFVENHGFGPHRAFFGGLLTTCGLDHIGNPGVRSADRFLYPSRSKEHLPMHGRYSGSPARLLGYGVQETEMGLEAFVEGEVRQVTVFGEHLVLRRRISILYGSGAVAINDLISNEGYAASPLAMMYHVNAGWPLVAPGAKISVAGTKVRSDSGDPEGVAVPARDARQAVTVYRMKRTADSVARAEITNGEIAPGVTAGLRLRWDVKALPSLVEWQLFGGAGHYVVGLEPTTMITHDTGEETFPELAPGDQRRHALTLELLHSEL